MEIRDSNFGVLRGWAPSGSFFLLIDFSLLIFWFIGQLGSSGPDRGQLGPPVSARSTLVNDVRNIWAEAILALILGRDTVLQSPYVP
jgi:hypothetical protein